MKYTLGSLTVEAVDTFVRITIKNFGGIDAKPFVQVSKIEKPTAADIAQMIASVRGYYPDSAVLVACGRAANDAINNSSASLVNL